MKKWNWVFGLIIIVLIASGCVLNEGASTEPAPTSSTTTVLNTSAALNECAKIEMDKKQKRCYLKLGQEEENIELCKQVKNPRGKDLCFKGVGTSSLDIEACSKIKNDKIRNGCYLYLGMVKLNTTICKKITTLTDGRGPYNQDQCYQYIAEKLENPNICENIHSSSDVNFCYLNIADITFNKSLCKKITDKSLKKSCPKNLEKYENICRKGIAKLENISKLYIKTGPNKKISDIPFTKHYILEGVTNNWHGTVFAKSSDMAMIPCRKGENPNYIYCRAVRADTVEGEFRNFHINIVLEPTKKITSEAIPEDEATVFEANVIEFNC